LGKKLRGKTSEGRGGDSGRQRSDGRERGKKKHVERHEERDLPTFPLN